MPPRVDTLIIFTAHVVAWLTFIFGIGVSCVAFLSQAVRTSSRRSFKNNINVLIIGVAYALVFVMSIALCVKRRISMFRRLQRMSKGRMAIGRGDVPKAVQQFITQEYARSCGVAFESVPQDAYHDGWGRPGSKYADVHFRRSLLNTVRDIDALSRLLIPSLPPLRPNDRMLHHFRFIAPLIPKDEHGLSALHLYDSAIQMARHSEREPTEREYAIAIDSAERIKQVLWECRLEMYEGGSMTELNTPSLNSIASQ